MNPDKTVDREEVFGAIAIRSVSPAVSRKLLVYSSICMELPTLLSGSDGAIEARHVH